MVGPPQRCKCLLAQPGQARGQQLASPAGSGRRQAAGGRRQRCDLTCLHRRTSRGEGCPRTAVPCASSRAAARRRARAPPIHTQASLSHEPGRSPTFLFLQTLQHPQWLAGASGHLQKVVNHSLFRYPVSPTRRTRVPALPRLYTALWRSMPLCAGCRRNRVIHYLRE